MSVVNAVPDVLTSPTYLGPVGSVVYTMRPSWSSGDGPYDSVSFSGTVLLRQARAVKSLVDNQDAWTTIAGVSGVLEYVWMGAAAVTSHSGWYLFTGASFEPMKPGDFIPYVPLRLDGVYLGDRDPALVVSSRELASIWDHTPEAVVSSPFADDDNDGFLYSPGGTVLYRTYDPTPDFAPTVEPLQMICYRAAVGALAPVAYPVWTRDPTLRMIANRGADVRAVDRRLEEQVHGPIHSFATTSDLRVSNGLVRFTPGPRGMQAFVAVEAIDSEGVWQSMGCLFVSDGELLGTSVMGGNRERMDVMLRCRGLGPVVISLCRHERMLRVVSGPGAAVQRLVGWRHSPPGAWSGATIETNGDDRGVRVDDGYALFQWPADVDLNSVWITWVPDTSIATTADSGIAAVLNADLEEIGSIWFRTSDNTIRWDVDGTVLSTPSLVGAADTPVQIMASQRADGRTLTVKAGGNPVTVSDARGMMGTPAFLSVGQAGAVIGTVGFGEYGFGEGSFGGPILLTPGTSAHGIVSHARIFDSPVTEAMAMFTAEGEERLGHPQGRIVLDLPMDRAYNTAGSDVDNGITFDTLSGIRNGPWGLTRGLVTRQAVTKGTGTSVKTTGAVLEVGAFMATNGGGDDVDDHANQYAASNRHHLTVT